MTILVKRMRGGMHVSGDLTAVSPSTDWGWLPALSLVSAFGLLLLALADNGARMSASWADVLFWIGLIALFVPIAARLLSFKASRRETIGLLVMLGSMMCLVKVLQYPLGFAYNDEFQHAITAQDIVSSAHLFRPNPLLPVSPWYPGLEIVTTALGSLSGLPLFIVAIIVIGVMRLIFTLALFLFYEQISHSIHIRHSTNIAGIATLLNMTQSSFLFFGAQFVYGNLAIPLAVLALWIMVRHADVQSMSRRGLVVVALLGLAAVTVTHHVTSYMLTLFLILWCVISLFSDRGKRNWVNPWGLTLAGAVMGIAWLMFVGNIVIGYLGPFPVQYMHDFIQALTGRAPLRPLFKQLGSQAVPQWERVIALASAGFILIWLPFGLFQIWRRYRAHSLTLTLAAASLLLYPFSLLIRFTPTGGNTADRLPVYMFIPLAFVLAVGARPLMNWMYSVTLRAIRLPRQRSSFLLEVIMTSIVAVLLIGGVVQGNGQIWTQIPVPYIVGAAGEPSVDFESVSAAKWMRAYVGPGQRITSDSTNQLLMGVYGNEWVVTGLIEHVEVAPLFTSLQLGPYEKAILQQLRLHYLVVDLRQSTDLPAKGFYFDGGEPEAFLYTAPINPTALAKFVGVQNVNRIFDSGDIVIYDVGAIANGPSTTSSQVSLCTPAPPTAISSSYPQVAKLYTGTIHDIPTDITTKISLTGIQQQQGSICGYFSGLGQHGSFQGTITTSGHIQFVVTGNAVEAPLTFDGFMQSDGNLAGSYCHSDRPGQCRYYGLWSVSPAKSG